LPAVATQRPQVFIVNKTATDTLSKVPAVTLGFWVIKIAATTLGETGGDAVTMTLNLGYLIGTLIFGVILVTAVSTQIFAKRFHPFLYWAVVVATTTVGTTLADFVDRSLGIGYLGAPPFFAKGGIAFGRFSASAVLLAFMVVCILLLPQRAGTHPGASDTVS
jgi:uncharacterized membrane-anchored protein